jgi:glyceraldehyde 3-phosphate dehydrogenase
MATKIGINGFGRIGRQIFRIAHARGLDIVLVNDLVPNETMAQLLRYDSNYGKFQGTVSHDEENLIVDGKKIRVTAIKDPTTLPWKELGVDVVVESTGIFTKREQAALHLEAGAKRVLISAPATGADLTVVYGEGNGKNILGVSNETTCGLSRIDLPKTKGSIPRSG